jgi:hypothetical protein
LIFRSSSFRLFVSRSSSSSLLGNRARRDFADGVLPADEFVFFANRNVFGWVIGANGEICLLVWLDVWVESGLGGNWDDGRSSAVKKRKAPLLVVDTGIGILEEVAGDWTRLK